MRFGEKTLPLVAQSFGLRELYAGIHSVLDGQGQKLGGADIEYLWLARIMGWTLGPLTMSYAHCSSYLGRKNTLLGVLLVPQRYLDLEFLGKNPFRCVELLG